MTARLYRPALCLFAWGLGLLTAALSWFSRNNLELPPELWGDVAVAAKLRAPVHEFPLLWHNVLSRFMEQFGLAGCVSALKIAGAVSLGLLSALTFRFFAGFVADAADEDQDALLLKRRRTAKLAVTVLSTLLFVCSEPVWLAGRVLSPEMFALLLTMLALTLLQRAAVQCGYRSLAALGIFSGVLAAETPLGALPPLGCAVLLRFKDWDLIPAGERPALGNPVVITVAVRRMIWSFVIAWAVTLALNLAFYRADGGGGESDVNVFLGAVKYLFNYFGVVGRAASPFGFLLIAAFVVAPLVIALARLKKLCDPSLLLPIRYAVFLAVAGTLALSQSTGFKGCHFWRWIDGAVSSQYLLCLAMLATTLTVLAALHVFAVDIFFRDHVQVLRDTYPEAMLEENPLLGRVIGSYGKIMAILRPAAGMVPLAALAAVLPFKFDGTLREMMSIVNSVAVQSVAECAGAAMIFTDGSFDAGVELAAAMEGRRLKALSMMSKNGRYDVALRLRGETDEARRSLLEAGTAEALRTWVTEKDPCVSNIALQVGMELWRHRAGPVPKAGGLVMRTASFAPGEAEKAAEAARSLAERILKLCGSGEAFRCGYSELNRLFMFAQWRLSRMCRMRAHEADREKRPHHSEMENSLADRLDEANPEWRRVQEKMDWIGRQEGMRLTPQEGLKLGLERADFRLARVYAQRVLSADPGDLKANFAMGMGFIVDRQYVRAEKHLRRCLAEAPEEPAVLNNLAIVLLRLGRYVEAETNAVKALGIMPDSPEIKTTLRHIRTARNSK